MMSKTAAEPLVRISKREGTTFVQKVLVRVRRYVERHVYEHHPFLLGAA